MGHTKEALTQNLAERLCGEMAHRHDARIARGLYRKRLVDGAYRLGEGTLPDDFYHFCRPLG